VYGSTGNQPTLSQTVRLERWPKATRLQEVERVRELDDAVYGGEWKDGPSFLLVKGSELAEDVGRVKDLSRRHEPSDFGRPPWRQPVMILLNPGPVNVSSACWQRC